MFGYEIIQLEIISTVMFKTIVIALICFFLKVKLFGLSKGNITVYQTICGRLLMSGSVTTICE